MTTYNEPITSHHDAADRDRFGAPQERRPDRRRGHFIRSAALGASVTALMFGGIFAATELAHHNGGSTTAHASVTPSQSPAAAGTAAGAASGTAAAGTGGGHAAGGHSGHAGGGSVVPSRATILALQKDLGQLNYYEGAMNGINGSATTAAVANFQRANGLTVDGVAGPRTMALIKKQLITGDNQMGGGSGA